MTTDLGRDVGTFDGFYPFLAEARGARDVVAVDNEQYRVWVKSRWGVELEAKGRSVPGLAPLEARVSLVGPGAASLQLDSAQ